MVYTNRMETYERPEPDTPAAAPATAVPRYIQIAERLIRQIEAGELAPGDRLPPERDLSREHGVNRMTLRQALQVLKGRGLITQRQGAGTFVATPKIERAAGRLWPFSTGILELGLAPGARIILFERRAADRRTAERLGMLPNAQIYYSHRLRLAGGDPVVLEQFALPADRFPGIEGHDLARRSIYEIMRTEYGVTLAHARQSLEPVVATAYEAGLLCVPAGAPLMLEQRVTFDERGQAVEYSNDLYRGDRFRFVTELALITDATGNTDSERGGAQ